MLPGKSKWSAALAGLAAVGLWLGSAPADAASASEPFYGTIMYAGFNFAPRGWAHCDGQLLAVSSNDALFSLLGTTYGGDGRTTFALPDMRGRVPVHQGQGPGLSSRRIGEKGGQETVTLMATQAGHGHGLQGNAAAGNQGSPAGHSLASDGADQVYLNAAPDVAMNAGSVEAAGGSQPHENRPPLLGVYCNIALFGVYPTRN
jgi:microcystin-dependent protein